MIKKLATSIVLAITVLGGREALARHSLETVLWVDSTRDVHINGDLDKAAQVMISDETRRIALFSPKLGRVAVLDLDAGTVTGISRQSFCFAVDHASAQSSADLGGESAGNYTMFDDSDYYFTIEGSRVLIAAYEGLTGEVDTQKLFETVPVWRSLMEAYKPDLNAVADIRATPLEVTLTVAFATWCSDSKRYVPRLLKALETAGNRHLHIKLIGIARKFKAPAEPIKRLKIVRVPTVIVERDGVEIGRIVENPTAKTIEEDLAGILNRQHKAERE